MKRLVGLIIVLIGGFGFKMALSQDIGALGIIMATILCFPVIYGGLHLLVWNEMFYNNKPDKKE